MRAGNGAARSRTPRQLVLLVEPSPVQARIVADLLSQAPGTTLRTTIVSSADEALDLMVSCRPDAALVDVALLGDGGRSCLQRLRQADPALTIVGLAEADVPEIALAVIRAGADDVLARSAMSAGSLARTIRYAIERRRNLRALVSEVADGLVVFDREGVVRFANPAAQRLTGRDEARWIGQPLDLGPVGPDGALDVTTGDGESRRVEVRYSAIEWGGEPCRLASLRDVTEQHRTDELRQRLLHSDKLASIGQLSAGVAHEINNPATFVVGNLEMLREWICEHLPASGLPEVADCLEMVEDCIVGMERITSIVAGLRNFSRIERDDIEMVDLNRVVEAACALTRNETRHRAHLEQQLAPLPPLAADQGKLCQLLVNLLVNAAHAFDGASVDAARIEVGTRDEGDSVVLWVRDNGCGMEETTRAHIFEPFYTTKGRDKGTGLGLALAAETVRAHGGIIEVASEIGVGTTFTVRLPRESGLEPGARTPPLPPLARARPGRVLLVDDDARVRRSLARALSRQHEVVQCDGGRAALAAIDGAPGAFDAILCDLMMPDLDGTRLHQILRERHPALLPRLIFLSGGAFTARAKSFVAAHEVRLLEKPIRPRALLDVVNRLISSAAEGASGAEHVVG